MKHAIDLRVARRKQLDAMPAPLELLAEMVYDSFRSAVGFWRHGHINAGDLCDLHGQPGIIL
jgi:hypothetical protein